ncbi:MAG: sigma-54 dependent transcriptional regulator [Kiritimatiellia bacterium]
MARILLVDDDKGVLQVLGAVLQANGHETVQALGGDKAQEIFTSDPEFDLMISDVRMSPVDGTQLLEFVHEKRPELPVVMLTAYGQVETAARVMKLGAFDYVLKPFKPDELMFTVAKALEHGGARLKPGGESEEDPEIPYLLGNTVAASKEMKNVCEMIRRAAPLDIPVMIFGEAGTGRTHVANVIHEQSKRNEKKIVTLDCAGAPDPVLEIQLFGCASGTEGTDGKENEGVLETAAGSSVILREIGSLPPALQSGLAEALAEKEFRKKGGRQKASMDARLLALSGESAGKLLEAGRLDKRLGSLLGVLAIEMKPLRERPGDIAPLARHFLGLASDGENTPRIDPATVEILESYRWPGNARELFRVMTDASNKSSDGVITRDSLPEKIASTRVIPRKRPSGAADPFKGRSMKAFVEAKKEEYLEQIRKRKNE